MADEIIVEDTNPEIKTYSYDDVSLIVEKTHAEPTVRKEVHNIEEIQEKIAKINSVISLWESKKVSYQELLDKYTELKPVVKKPEEIIEK